jgi:glucans biosynthesis protein C
VLRIFCMTVFLVLAGFFARLLIEKRGVGGFMLNRAKRIAIPLIAFWPVAIAGIIAVAIWAAVQANGGVMPEGPPPPATTVENFPLTHLWFLFVTTVALGIAVFGDIGVYLLILSIALIVLMALPGWVIWPGAKKAA